MPIVVQILCYNCQAIEKHANHCYAVSLENNSFSLKPLALTPRLDNEELSRLLPSIFLQSLLCRRSVDLVDEQLYDDTAVSYSLSRSAIVETSFKSPKSILPEK